MLVYYTVEEGGGLDTGRGRGGPGRGGKDIAYMVEG
jgi:hypothetical protein